MCSSSARTPKSQLTPEQPLIGECWIPPKKGTPHPRAQEKPLQDGRRGEITFRNKPRICQRCSEGSNKTLCTPGCRDLTETEPDLPLSVCLLQRLGQQRSATGTGAVAAADLGGSACGINPQSHQADDPQTGQQLYQRHSRTVEKVLRPTIDSPACESGKGTDLEKTEEPEIKLPSSGGP